MLEDRLYNRPMVPVELYAISHFWPAVETRAVSERAFLSVELPYEDRLRRSHPPPSRPRQRQRDQMHLSRPARDRLT
jgi:hypothetical protein